MFFAPLFLFNEQFCAILGPWSKHETFSLASYVSGRSQIGLKVEIKTSSVLVEVLKFGDVKAVLTKGPSCLQHACSPRSTLP